MENVIEKIKGQYASLKLEEGTNKTAIPYLTIYKNLGKKSQSYVWLKSCRKRTATYYIGGGLFH